jgi:putative oxidoreductase
MFKRVVATANDYSLTIMRLVLGLVFTAHGAQKMLGWFGGNGFSASMGMFTYYLHIPAPLAFLAIAAEFFGGIGLLVGLLGRVAALGIVTNMVVAVLMVHYKFGLFMNWAGAQKGEGIEYHLLAIALGLAIVIKGSGALSVDRFLSTPRKEPVASINQYARRAS